METIVKPFGYINKNRNIITCYAIGLILLIVLSHYGKFCDEFDVMTGSWLISKGWILYKDIFSHHMPFTYYFMAIFHLFGVSSPLGLRYIFVMVVFSYFLFIAFFFGKRIDKTVFGLALIMYAMTSLFFSGQMVLADSFFAMSVAIIFLEVYVNPELKFIFTDQIIISVSTFVAITSTQIALYPLIIYYIFYITHRIYSAVKAKQIVKYAIDDAKFFSIVLTPFIIWFIYMMVTDSVGAFISNGLIFNIKYYSKFVNDDTPITLVTNHLKVLPTYVWRIFLNLVSFKNFKEFAYNFFPSIMKASLIIFVIVQIKKKNYIFSFLFATFTYFCNMRAERFHETPFNIICIMMLSIMIVEYYRKVKIAGLSKYSIAVLVSLWLIVIVFTYNFSLFISTERKIYETNDVIEMIKSATNDGDTIWCAPLSPEIYLITNRLPADGNIFYLPWQSAVPNNNQRIIENLINKQPKIIYFVSSRKIYGYKLMEYGNPIYSYLQKNYFTMPSNENIYYNNLYKEEMFSLKNLDSCKVHSFNPDLKQSTRLIAQDQRTFLIAGRRSRRHSLLPGFDLCRCQVV